MNISKPCDLGHILYFVPRYPLDFNPVRGSGGAL